MHEVQLEMTGGLVTNHFHVQMGKNAIYLFRNLSATNKNKLPDF